VLCFDVSESDLAQPKAVVLGHTLSATAGVCVRYFATATGINEVVAPALAVAICVAIMRICKCTHPPGGATALFAVIGGTVVEDMGFLYVLINFIAAVMLLLTALVLNNLVRKRSYPLYWN
jgi:CBS domain-containing membrane protein